MSTLPILVFAAASIGFAAAADTDLAPELQAVRVPIENYIKGQVTGDGDYIRKAFHIEGRMTFVRDGKLVMMSGEEFAKRFNGKPSADEASRKRWIDHIDLQGNVAVVRVILDYPEVKFTDYMTVLKTGGEWKIINKSFHSEAKSK
jgi:hypothetical protein